MSPRSYAVIGGGLSGLSTAWHLAHLQPESRITVFEAAPRWGGWLHSIREPLPGSDRGVLFELGPRTLRPAGAPGVASLQLVHALGISKDVVKVPKTSPAAKDRFLYVDGKLERLGGSMFRGSYGDIARGMMLNHQPRPNAASQAGFDDETIWEFFARRLGPRLADMLATAMVHGIYSGDARKLSIRSTFRSVFEAERRIGAAADKATSGRLLAAWKTLKKVERPDVVRNLEQELVRGMDARQVDQILPWRTAAATEFATSVGKDTSVYTFTEGISYLSNSIVSDLAGNFPNVTLRKSTSVSGLLPKPDGSITVETKTDGSSGASTETFDHVTSAVSAPVLANMMAPVEDTAELRDLLRSIEFSTVAVINFAYAGKPEDILPVLGFGFLVPLKDMMTGEGVDALGVVFDSCSAGAQDQGVLYEGKPITRLTVMMGGHAFRAKFGDPDRADSAELVQRARKAVQRTLFSTKTEPELIASHVSIQKDCIPQYGLGHDLKLSKIRDILDSDRRWQKRLSVCHASYMGVSMNDCIMYGRELAVKLAASERGLEVDTVSGLRQ